MATPLALARQIASRVNMREIMIAPICDFASDLVQLAGSNAEQEKAAQPDNRMELCAMYGIDGYTEKPFAFAGGIAIIPIHGSLINRFSHSWGFVTGYNFIRNQLKAALDDDDVKVIVFDVNTYGGEVAGCFETADEIFLSRGDKPLIAMVDTNCYSAGYALASSCDRIIVTPSGGVGSIGAMCMHVSLEKMLDNFGVKVTPIYSGSHKVDGNPYKDLPESVRAEIQTGVDSSRDLFVSLVARNIGLSEKVIYDTQAATYRTPEALAMGLIHEIATPSEAALKLLTQLNETLEEDDMPTAEELATAAALKTEAAAAAAPAVIPAAPADAAAAKNAERQRCASITQLPEAAANPALANHLAFNTEMSVTDAQATLAAAGPAKTAAAPAPVVAPAAGPKADKFAEAMDSQQQPEVGADGDLAVQRENASKPGANLLASLALAGHRI
jgi:capsid assembly protease